MEFTNIDIKKGADNVKGFVKEANQTALKTSDKLVEGSLEAAEQWQKVAEKALKTGTVIFGKQQDLALTILEGLKKQGLMGAARLKNLFAIDESMNPTKAIKKKVQSEVAKVNKNVEMVEKHAKAVVTKAAADVKDAAKAVAKKAATTETKAKKTVTKTAAKAKTTTKKVAAKAKATPSVSAKKTTTKKTTKAANVKDDLKSINGVGPKMETVLNSLGILTFADLAKADAKKLSADLTAVNARYAMFETADWVKEAASK